MKNLNQRFKRHVELLVDYLVFYHKLNGKQESIFRTAVSEMDFRENSWKQAMSSELRKDPAVYSAILDCHAAAADLHMIENGDSSTEFVVWMLVPAVSRAYGLRLEELYLLDSIIQARLLGDTSEDVVFDSLGEESPVKPALEEFLQLYKLL